jgi:hypothetical protein
LFVVEDFAVGQAGAVVERGVDMAVAGAAVAAHAVLRASSVHAPAATGGDGRQLLHIDMDQLARTLPLVARGATGLVGGPVAPVEATETGLVQDRLDRRGRQADLVGDVVGTPPPPAAELDHPTTHPARSPTR